MAVGVSGDGDTASIGIGQFVHLLRRNLPIVYVVENNGVYGLTKGQFSATADLGSKLKTGVVNDLPAIDLCTLAIELGATYVARSFAGDPKQVVALLKGAFAHSGTAVLDIISPCVTFNNHEGSTKSYTWGKEHEELLHDLDFIPFFEPIEVEYDEGQTTDVELHDGDILHFSSIEFRLGKLQPHETDPIAGTPTSLDPELPRRLIEHARLLDELLREGAVTAAVQPIVDIATGRPMGFEVLGRGGLARLPQSPRDARAL